MAITEMFFWWYSQGWKVFIEKVHTWFSSVTDFFSMSSLLRTLFKPYRQISADSAGSNASLDLKFHMFLDRLISRTIGFISRLIILTTGLIIIIVVGTLSLVMIIIWPVIPFIPLVGMVLSVTGFII